MATNVKRFFGLDLLRSFAILFVIIYHSTHLLNPIGAASNVFGKVIALSNPLGMLGVEMFFVLSGFLIGGILLNIVLQKQHFTLHDLKIFWIRRWFRTLPLYYFILLISSLLYNALYDLAFDWRYLFFVQNFNSPHPSFLGEAWSLCIEEWFYISFPFLLFSTLIIFRRVAQPSDMFLYTIIFYCLLFQLTRLINAFDPAYISLDSGLRKIVYLRLDAIGYGVLMAYLMKFKRDFLYLNKLRLLYISIIGVIFIIGLQYIGDMPSIGLFHKYAFFRFGIRIFLFTFLPIFFALLLPYFYFMKYEQKNLFSSAITQISLISYSIYLIHYSLLYIPIFKHIPNTTFLSSIILYITYWLSIFITAKISYQFIELPGLKLRDSYFKE